MSNTPKVDANQPALRAIPEDLIINALKCIDAACKRGAFHGGEMSTVGHVRDNLYASVADVIDAMMAEQQAQADAPEVELGPDDNHAVAEPGEPGVPGDAMPDGAVGPDGIEPAVDNVIQFPGKQ